MKLKYASFENQEEYEKALESGERPSWKRTDLDKDSVEDVFDFLETFAADDSSIDLIDFIEEVHVLVIDRDGESSDELRDHKPLKDQHNDRILKEITEYFRDKRPEDMQRLVTLAWQADFSYFDYWLCGSYFIYEHYSADVPGDVSDQEAEEAALKSPNGVLDVFYSREIKSGSELLKVTRFRDKDGQMMTHADCYRRKVL